MYHPVFQNCDWLPRLIEENVTTLDNYLYPHPLNFLSVCAKKVADLPHFYIHSSICISLILYKEALTLQTCQTSHGEMNRFYLYIKAVWQFRQLAPCPPASLASSVLLGQASAFSSQDHWIWWILSWTVFAQLYSLLIHSFISSFLFYPNALCLEYNGEAFLNLPIQQFVCPLYTMYFGLVLICSSTRTQAPFKHDVFYSLFYHLCLEKCLTHRTHSVCVCWVKQLSHMHGKILN